jgi:hypothetical protein
MPFVRTSDSSVQIVRRTLRARRPRFWMTFRWPEWFSLRFEAKKVTARNDPPERGTLGSKHVDMRRDAIESWSHLNIFTTRSRVYSALPWRKSVLEELAPCIKYWMWLRRFHCSIIHWLSVSLGQRVCLQFPNISCSLCAKAIDQSGCGDGSYLWIDPIVKASNFLVLISLSFSISTALMIP